MIDELIFNLVEKMNGSKFLASLARKTIPFSLESVMAGIQNRYDLTSMLDHPDMAEKQSYGIYLYKAEKFGNKFCLVLKDNGVHYIESYYDALEQACEEKIRLWAESRFVTFSNV